ncbi:MAG: prephenate dehydratase domain-containing protein, partial [Actinomycetota bacterium]
MTSSTPRRVGFLGPFGTFTDQAARTQSDLAVMELVPFRTVPDVLDAVEAGEID